MKGLILVDFQKAQGLVPAIIQDSKTNKVLMLGYMNEESLEKTKQEGKVTFFSRSKQRLWTKGETSGHFLHVKNITVDCDKDTLLIRVEPQGPVCHTGKDTCFDQANEKDFLSTLEAIIANRKSDLSNESYTSSLFKAGINRIAQKVAEEAVELVLEAKDNNKDLFLNEAADLLFHYLVLLQAKGFRLEDVIQILFVRHKSE